MTTIREGQRTGEHLASEANGYRSREQVTLVPGAYVAGQVLGRVATATVVATAVAGIVGNGAMGAITASSDAIQGVYLLKVTKAAAGAGDFEVIDPQGDVAGVGTVAAPFVGGGLSFTLAAGGTNFAVGDTFRLVVGAPVVTYAAHDPAATNGAQRAAAVLLAAGGLPAANSRGTAHVRACEVNGLLITWPAGISAANKAQGVADLASSGIIVRV